MIRINFRQQALHLFVFLILQIPLLFKLVLFDKAFGFFYIGFLLFLPHGLSRTYSMLIAFVTGLIIDVFSNTPGIHASACIFLVFAKDFWHDFIMGSSDDDVYINFNELGVIGSLGYLLPLTFIHHLIIFTVENGGFQSFGMLTLKVFYSSIYTFVIVFALSFLMAPKVRRV